MKIIVFILIELVCLACFSENPRWALTEEITIPARPDLVVRWETSAKAVPGKIWIYSVSPRDFSPRMLSNLMTMCSFTEKDESRRDTNEIVFTSSNGSRSLSIFLSSGSIRYEAPEHHYGPTNLAEGVPEMAKMPGLTKSFLEMVGIKPSEIERNTNGAPNFDFWEPFTWYFVHGRTITNIAFRAVVFSRAVDGISIIGDSGHCGLEFGEHGKISQIHLSWPNLKRFKSFPTLKPQAIAEVIRQGKARQGLLPDNIGGIDWSTVKSITVKDALPYYFSGPTRCLYPFLLLSTTVDTAHGTVDVPIECPIIDEAGI